MSTGSDEPLLGLAGAAAGPPAAAPACGGGGAAAWYAFLEARTPRGRAYEAFTILLIVANILTFVVGTLFVPEYNPGYATCNDLCDSLFFGNRDDNSLAGTSVVEIVTVAVFTVDYGLRFWCVGAGEPRHAGAWGRVRYVFTFFSLVDLVSILPFYVDFLVPGNLPASQFLRMFRLLRMMKVEGRYIEAFTLIDDVVREQKGVLGTAGFVGASTWVICAGFYYVAEHRSTASVYCGAATHCDADAVDVNACTFDEWGFVNCTAGGCPATADDPHPCWNLFQSIPGAMFFTLLNLFGEFPLIDQHSVAGKCVAVLVAVFAAAVFAIPAGILGNGFEDLLTRRREQKEEEAAAAKAEAAAGGGVGAGGSKRAEEEEEEEEEGPRKGTAAVSGAAAVDGDVATLRGQLYNFLHAKTSAGACFEYFIFFLIFATTLSFMFETTSMVEDQRSQTASWWLELFELVAVIVFTLEYAARLFAMGEDPRYAGARGRLHYACTFFALVDLVSVLPYWIDFAVTLAGGNDPFLNTSSTSTFVRSLRLLRILKAEKYTQAFTIFDDVIVANGEVLVVTGFSALVMWILFSAAMYYAERDNPDKSMQEYYNTVPNAMWMTLLNLSGEAPLCHYGGWGKVLNGIIGIFATGFFGIPIGLLGAGFEEWIDENEDDEDEDGDGGGDDGTVDDVERAADAAGRHTMGMLGDVRDAEVDRKRSWDSQGVLNDAYRRPSTAASSSASSAAAAAAAAAARGRGRGTAWGLASFLEGETSAGFCFEMVIFFLIFLTVTLGILETVDSLNCDGPVTQSTTVCDWFTTLEWIAVIVFSVEYLLRFVSAPATEILEQRRKAEAARLVVQSGGRKPSDDDDDGNCLPTFSCCGSARLRFVFSFYSCVDLLAILPFYLAEAMPGSWVDQNDEYFRMLRLLRLLKLDKYIPSITLIDDVFRLKKNALIVTGFAAGTLWILFSALQYITESGALGEQDKLDDPLPDYGCYENCTMANRFSSVFSALTYTGVHLTGDCK